MGEREEREKRDKRIKRGSDGVMIRDCGKDKLKV